MLLVAFGLSSSYSYASKTTNEKNDIQKSIADSNNGGTFFMKGDTLVYNPDAFIVREGASILEKISRFPGVTFDGYGNLFVKGKGTKVLVDGKEVFSSSGALEKIPAYMVASAQVYERVQLTNSPLLFVRTSTVTQPYFDRTSTVLYRDSAF